MAEALTHNLAEVAELIGVSGRTIQRLVQEQKFPKPIKLGSRSLWRRADVELFVASGSMATYRRAKSG